MFLIGELKNYRTAYPEEEASRDEIIEFIEGDPRCFEKINTNGHVTGSAMVINHDLTQVLLNHHRKLNKWIQFGGHSDGHNNPFEVAWREAEEESGLKSLRYIEGYENIFDLDVHIIAKIGDAPEHKHYDVRILLVCDEGEKLQISKESIELKWVKIENVKVYNNTPAFLRMIKKITSMKG